MARFAYVVAANHRYLPGLNAVLNSLDLVANRQDVHLVAYGLPETYLERIQAAFDFTVIVHRIQDTWISTFGEIEVLMRYRYGLPAEIGGAGATSEPAAVCILDADMFFCHNVDRYFEIAADAGLVLGCTLEQKRRYGDEHHQIPPGSGRYLIPPDQWNARDLCCAPLFVGRPWYAPLRRSWLDFSRDNADERIRCSDMDALNIYLLAAGSFERTIPLSQHTWTGLHECLMKAHTRAVELRGEPFTEDGEEINIIHGKYWSPEWRSWQVDCQFAMIDRDFNASAPYKHRAKSSFALVCRWWRRAACEHKVDVREWLPDLQVGDSF